MFQITRKGNFTVKLLPNSNHCGIKLGMNNFDYEVQIMVDDNYLDSRGFILDNGSIDEYFQNIGKTPLSCELLSREAGFHFWEALVSNSFAPGNSLSRSKQIVRIFVRVWGLSKIACIDFIWDRREGSKPLSAVVEQKELAKKKPTKNVVRRADLYAAKY